MTGPYTITAPLLRAFIQARAKVRQPARLPNGARLTREVLIDEIVARLTEKDHVADGNRQLLRWAKQRRKIKTWSPDVETLDWIANRIHAYECADPDARLARPRDYWEYWIPGARVYPADRADTLTEGDRRAARGEIWVTKEGKNRISHGDGYVHRLVAVHVDKVRFLQAAKNSDEIAIRDGNYIRIGVPVENHGAVGLFVDLETQEVVLTAQWRHSQKDFLIETPRGFSAPEDEDTHDTIEREGAEETGRRIEGKHVRWLRDLYTDTGKLWEQPSYFLVYVNRNDYDDKRVYVRDPIVAPLWVHLDEFYDAVFSGDEIELSRNPFDDPWLVEHRPHMLHLREKFGNRLKIVDAFTTTTAFLALPHLARERKLRNLGLWTEFRRQLP